jgi:ribosomal protein S18 acetylase RimI-like enzyme
MNVAVRRATAAERDVLVEFNRAMAAESEDKGLDLETLARGVDHVLGHSADGHYLVAELDDGAIAGALLITFEWSDWRDGRFWWIQSVYVRPEWRRRGVYRALHDHVRAEALDDADACGLRLYVEKENRGAQATYRTLGMSETHYQLWEEDFGA